MKLRLSDALPSPLTAITVTLMVWLTTRAFQLAGRKFPALLLGGVIPPSS